MVTEVLEQDRVSTWSYQTESTWIIPYVDGNPSTLFDENFLFHLYAKCKQQNLLDILFPGMPVVTPAKFVSYLSARPILVGLERSKHQITGFGFLYEVEGDENNKKGTVGFCFFREWWGSQAIRDASRLALRWWFYEWKLKIIFGTTLWRNRLAWKFAKALGFESVGKIPMFFLKNGQFEDMHLVYLKAEDFCERA